MVTMKRKGDRESYSHLPHYRLLWSPMVKPAFEPSGPAGQRLSLVFVAWSDLEHFNSPPPPPSPLPPLGGLLVHYRVFKSAPKRQENQSFT